MDRREVERVERRLNAQARKVISLQARNAELEAENAGLRRQRDELHATTAIYWNRIIGWQAVSKEWARLVFRALSSIESSKHHSAAQAQAYKAREAEEPLRQLLYGGYGGPEAKIGKHR